MWYLISNSTAAGINYAGFANVEIIAVNEAGTKFLWYWTRAGEQRWCISAKPWPNVTVDGSPVTETALIHYGYHVFTVGGLYWYYGVICDKLRNIRNNPVQPSDNPQWTGTWGTYTRSPAGVNKTVAYDFTGIAYRLVASGMYGLYSDSTSYAGDTIGGSTQVVNTVADAGTSAVNGYYFKNSDTQFEKHGHGILAELSGGYWSIFSTGAPASPYYRAPGVSGVLPTDGWEVLPDGAAPAPTVTGRPEILLASCAGFGQGSMTIRGVTQ